MNRGKDKIFLAAALLAMLSFHLCCTTLFPHTHTVDGKRISHSHPYSGNPQSPGHSHTAAQAFSLEQISSLLAVSAPNADATVLPVMAIALCLAYPVAEIARRNGIYGLRAPPVFCIPARAH